MDPETGNPEWTLVEDGRLVDGGRLQDDESLQDDEVRRILDLLEV